MARRPFARAAGPRRRPRSRPRSGSAPRAAAASDRSTSSRPGSASPAPSLMTLSIEVRPASGQGPRNRGATGVGAGSTVQSTRHRPRPRPRPPTRGRRPGRTRPMTQTAPPATDRPHRAAKRYIYAWGGGHAEGDATMRDLLGGKGAGLAEMTNAGLPVPPGFTITTEACNDYFTAGQQLPDGLWDDVLEAVKEVEAQTGKGFGDAADPLLVSVRSGAQVLDARDDGHGPQPRAQRGDPARARRADRQRALRLGRLPPLHPDVRADRHGREGRAVRHRARGRQARPGRRAGHRPRRRRPADARRGLQGHRPRGHRPGLPERPVRAARPGHQGRLRELVRQARRRLPQQPEDRPRPRARRSTS